MKKSLLSIAFDDLMAGMIVLDRGWLDEMERSGMRRAAGEVRHHVCAAIASLVHEPPVSRAGPPPQMTPEDRERIRASAARESHRELPNLRPEAAVYAHEAYVAVLAFGQLLLRANNAELCDPVALETCHESVVAMLDALSPFIRAADDGVRRVLLEEEPVELVAERIGRAG